MVLIKGPEGSRLRGIRTRSIRKKESDSPDPTCIKISKKYDTKEDILISDYDEQIEQITDTGTGSGSSFVAWAVEDVKTDDYSGGQYKDHSKCHWTDCQKTEIEIPKPRARSKKKIVPLDSFSCSISISLPNSTDR